MCCNSQKLFSYLALLVFLLWSYNSNINAELTKTVIASPCDHVTRRVLAAKVKSQRKTIIRRRLDHVAFEMAKNQSTPVDYSLPGKTRCDVWTAKAAKDATGQKNLTMTLISLDLQEGSRILLISESDERQIMLRSKQSPGESPAPALPVRIASPLGVSLIWAYTAQQPGISWTEEHLSFSYSLQGTSSGEIRANATSPMTTAAPSSDPTQHIPEKKEKAVLASAIIVSVVTASATVISIVRAGVCSRLRYLCQYRRVSKTDRILTERIERQDSIELNSLRSTTRLSRELDNCNNSEIFGGTSSNDRCANDFDSTDGNNILGAFPNGNIERRICMNSMGNIDILGTERPRDAGVLLELEVYAGEILQRPEGLPDNGNSREYNMRTLSSAIQENSDVSSDSDLRSNLSNGYVDRRRRVRFHQDLGNNDKEFGLSEAEEPMLSGTCENIDLYSSAQVKEGQLQPIPSTPYATPDVAPVLHTTFTAASLLPAEMANGSQSTSNSCVIMSSPSNRLQPTHQHLANNVSIIHSSHEMNSLPNTDTVANQRPSTTVCPNCSCTSYASEIQEGRQPIAPLILPSGISRFASLDQTDSRHSYGETPPPAYSALFPE